MAFSNITNIKLKQICDKYCKNTNIAVAFSSLKIGSFFSCKDSIPKFFQSYVVYQFTLQAVMLGALAKPSATWRLELKNILGNIKIHKYSSIYKKIHTVDKIVILTVLTSSIVAILILGCNSSKPCK